ncbi:MAG: LLM class F420-dependent oxidoreductase [Propionibacteriales bacterium]|nr:LLM class F420-dependent oxidoreductase [Propionibacteriales bacterium]
MQLSMALMYAGDPRESADQVVALEKAGLDIVWIAEAYGYDSPTLMGYLAARTETVKIGSAILNVYSRTPALLAQTAAGLDHVSGGRAILGIGASGPQVIEGWHGVPYEKPLTRTREIIDIVRRAIRREVITNDGLIKLPLPEGEGTGLGKPLKLLNHPVRDTVPIYVASLGAKNVEMTAELADGWLPFLYVPEKAKDVWGDALAAGTAKRSAELAPLEISAGGMLAIGDDVRQTLDLARPVTALYIGGMGARGKNFYFDLACRYGYEAEAIKIQDLYLDGKKTEAAAAVPQELLELSNLVGPESYVRERIEAFRESGVTILQVVPIDADPAGLVSKVKSWIG